MSAPTPAPPGLSLRAVGASVDRQASQLQQRVLRNDAAAIAALARLRRGVGIEPGALIELLVYTHHDDFAPESMSFDQPTRAERAAHTALTLFALHQQSQGTAMHKRYRNLGSALRALGGAEIPEPLLRRFRVLGTSDDFAELTHHLRGAVQLLRQGRQPLDYGRLADQLVSWQFPGGPSSVRLQWGRDFYRTQKTTDPDTTGTETDQETSS